MKILLFFIAIALYSPFIKAQETYKRAKIIYTSQDQLRALEDAGIPMDHGIRDRDNSLISDFSETELQQAQNMGAQVEVLIEDVQAYYTSQRSPVESSRNPVPCNDDTGTTITTPANYNNGSMGGFLTYQEVLDELDDMRALFPNLISAKAPISDFETEGVEPAGYNITPGIGGNNILWVRISDNPDTDTEGEPQMLYTSLHHAREPASMQQLIFYMWYLLENYDSDPEIQAIVDNTELVFVPVVNPDGYLFNQFTNPNGGGLWRKNRNNGNGVDNNRNYDYHINGNPNNGSWGGPGSSGNPNSCTFRGSGPFSEIENQAIKWFVEQNDFAAAMNNHTFGQILFFPFGYADVPTPEENVYDAINPVLVSQNGFDPRRDSPFSGDSDDFMYGTVGTHDRIFAFTPEIGNQFWPPAGEILGINQSMVFFNMQIAQMVNAYAKAQDTTPLFLGEDTTPDIAYAINSLSINDDITNNFEVRIEAISSNITSTGTVGNHNNLFADESDTGAITITLDPNIATGEEVVFDIVVDGGAIEDRLRVTKFFGEPEEVFSDSGNSATANFVNQGWGVTSAEFVSPSSSITDSPGGNYSSNQNERITLEDEIDLTEAVAATVSYYALWEIEAGFDYAQFEISRDGGATWEPQCGNFTTIGNNNQDTGQPLYDGNQPDWVLENIDLSEYLGDTILARFQLITDGIINQDGFYFDDLTFNVINEAPLALDDEIVQNFSFYPNPTTDRINITTTLSSFTTTIYNIQGQQVSRVIEHQGNSQLDLSALAIGMYFIELQSEGSIRTIRVVKQ